jgi:hypothetical protein
MSLPVLALPTVEELRLHVRETLCAHDHLDATETRLAQAVIMRSGRPCGLFLQVRGPRLLRTHAVWVGDEQRILFYDSCGARFAETRLCEAPDHRRLAA